MSDLTGVSNEGITRREFSLQSALAILATCIITVSEDACGSKSPTTPTPAPTVNDVTGSISANHGHTATIKAADITAGNAISLDIQGSATHPHTVAISQSDLQTLKNRQAVSRDSSNNSGHSHTVTFTPA